jgi:TIGR03009 family protein
MRLRSSHLMSLALAVVAATALPLCAQDRLRNADQDIAPKTDEGRVGLSSGTDEGRVGPRAGEVNDGVEPRSRAPRGSLTRPEMRIDPVDPEVDRLLRAWSDHTKQIKTLTGKHYRSTRNYTFGSESLAEGKFFVNMPDMGRLDVGRFTAPNPKPGDVKPYRDAKGAKVDLTVKYEEKREKWICDGKMVKVIDDNRRTYEQVPIPPDQQGVNMIDGPLPFLLGMPADKAEARYRFNLLQEDRERHLIWIEVKPKFALDAAEWVRAYVLLNLNTYLPERVNLWNPPGTVETVYIFQEINTNEPGMLKKFFSEDPFKPNVWGYKREVHAPQGDSKNAQDRRVRMPMVVGASKDQALQFRERFKALGFDVEFKRGSRAPSDDQIYHIESQQPEANTPLKPGEKVVLRWYDKTESVDKSLRQ